MGVVIGNMPVKIKGVNISPYFYVSGKPPGWEHMLVNWEFIFDPYMKGIIDRAVDELGVNTFRLIGSPEVVIAGGLTRERYLEVYSEYISYCASKGCYVQACGGAWQNIGTVLDPYPTFPAADELIIPELVAFSLMAEQHENVIGIDLIQEVNGWPDKTMEQQSEFIHTTIEAVKAAGVTKPLTFSFQPVNDLDASIFSFPIVAAVADVVDYFDFHVYYPLENMADMAPALQFNKPIIWGECGVSKVGDRSFGGRRNEFINLLAGHMLDDNLSGFSFWCLNEDTTPADDFDWAFFDNAGGTFSQQDVDDYKAIPIPSLATITANMPTIVIANKDASFTSCGISSDNTFAVYLVGSPIKSYIPGREINPISSFEKDKTYYIVPKKDINLRSSTLQINPAI